MSDQLTDNRQPTNRDAILKLRAATKKAAKRIREGEVMLEVILHCANGKYCVFQLEDVLTSLLRGNYLAPGQDEDGYYLDANGVIEVALQRGWQEVERDGKRVYICAECVEEQPPPISDHLPARWRVCTSAPSVLCSLSRSEDEVSASP